MLGTRLDRADRLNPINPTVDGKILHVTTHCSHLGMGTEPGRSPLPPCAPIFNVDLPSGPLGRAENFPPRQVVALARPQ